MREFTSEVSRQRSLRTPTKKGSVQLKDDDE
jgi:hypothetical protein